MGMELISADIDSIDMTHSPLYEYLSESSCRRANIETLFSCNIQSDSLNIYFFEESIELSRTSRDPSNTFIIFDFYTFLITDLICGFCDDVSTYRDESILDKLLGFIPTESEFFRNVVIKSHNVLMNPIGDFF
jgi:hypothetical protein